MSFFEKSHHFTIKGGTYTSVAGDYYVQHGFVTGLQILYQRIAGGAFYDSAERFPPPRCHPETRKAIVGHILQWIADLQRSTQVLWLNGPVGAGKSAIAQTIAEMCGEIGQVTASFFFSRTSFNRNTEKYFIATIAHQLAHSVPGLKEHINRAVEENPSILDRSLERQLQDLVLKPVKRLMEQLGDNRPAWPQVIIVDGLDECHGEDAQCLILDIISRLTTELPFCFLLASRPEAHIQEIFSDPQSHLGTISHDIFLDNSSSAADDIRLFLKSSFLEIRQKP